MLRSAAEWHSINKTNKGLAHMHGFAWGKDSTFDRLNPVQARALSICPKIIVFLGLSH
mgnify:CR=1 FL=1